MQTTEYCARPEYYGVCGHRDVEMKCNSGERCGYQIMIEPQLEQKLTLAELSKQECKFCVRNETCKLKEFAEKFQEALLPTVSALFCISETLVEASKQHISPEEALKNIRVQLSEKQPVCSELQPEKVLDKLLEETEN